MIDPRRLREQTEQVRARLAARNPAAVALLEEYLAVDANWRAATREIETLKAERNRLAKLVGAAKKNGEPAEALLAESKAVSDKITQLEAQGKAAEADLAQRALFLPNPPHDTVPTGSSAEDNVEVGSWGEKPSFAFTPKSHTDLGVALGLLDFERAAKISGSGFVTYCGDGARLERALIQFLLDLHSTEHGYTEVSPPYLINRASMTGTGQLPKFEEDMYGVRDEDLFLAPTAEVPVTNLHRDELLSEAVLPIKYCAYTPCFRREAGSSGRDTRGLIRMHQFDKVELVKIVRPDRSYEELEALRADAERVLQKLGLHYRTVVLCTGDMGFGAAKCYDIEVWAPGEGRYLEVSSCSNFEEFQARRLNLRFKDAQGKNHPCHTLNGSGTALARLFVALVETYQQEDGTVRLPEALHPYWKGEPILRSPPPGT
jgi:seryl-tRNA synthetase